MQLQTGSLGFLAVKRVITCLSHLPSLNYVLNCSSPILGHHWLQMRRYEGLMNRVQCILLISLLWFELSSERKGHPWISPDTHITTTWQLFNNSNIPDHFICCRNKDCGFLYRQLPGEFHDHNMDDGHCHEWTVGDKFFLPIQILLSGVAIRPMLTCFRIRLKCVFGSSIYR